MKRRICEAGNGTTREGARSTVAAIAKQWREEDKENAEEEEKWREITHLKNWRKMNADMEKLK